MAEITNWETDTYASGDTMPPSQGMSMRDQILKNAYDYWVFDYTTALNSMSVKPTKAVTGTNFKAGTLAFQDAAIPLETFQPIIAPDWIKATTDITIKLYWYSSAITGAVMWRHALVGVAAGESIDPALTWTDWTVETTPAVANTLKVSSKTVTAGSHGLSAGDLVFFGIGRNGTHASDTLTVSAMLIHAIIVWRKGV